MEEESSLVEATWILVRNSLSLSSKLDLMCASMGIFSQFYQIYIHFRFVGNQFIRNLVLDSLEFKELLKLHGKS